LPLNLLFGLTVQLLRGSLIRLLAVFETADADKRGNREDRPDNEREYRDCKYEIC
jgi:hypothetical protein